MKILVVEDDGDVRDCIVQTLTEAGYSVDAVDNGTEGVYQALEWKYDVIVLDVMLPGIDGWAILDRLRGRNVSTPILMLTALGELNDRVKGLDHGADDYLAKPYHARELLARVRALSRRSIEAFGDIVELGRVVINLLENRVECDGEEVRLTPTQHRILAYLVKRTGRVVPRSDLVDAIYGTDDESNSNVIEVQIYHIRQKLGKDFLQSRRGLGYIIPKH